MAMNDHSIDDIDQSRGRGAAVTELFAEDKALCTRGAAGRGRYSTC
jgi:hypothetical protein